MRNAILTAFALLGLLVLPARIALADDAAAARMFKSRCAGCHGPDGKGATKQGEKMKIRDLTSASMRKELTNDLIKTTILDGIERDKDGVKQEMKPLKGKITDEQLAALVAYVKGLR